MHPGFGQAVVLVVLFLVVNDSLYHKLTFSGFSFPLNSHMYTLFISRFDDSHHVSSSSFALVTINESHFSHGRHLVANSIAFYVYIVVTGDRAKI